MNTENLTSIIKIKAEETLNEKVDNIEKIDQVINNSAYKISTGKKDYIFKIYRSNVWPEDGKLTFVNNKLIENNIPCAKIITFNRNDDYFTNGFLIEEYIPGIIAGNLQFTPAEEVVFYKKLSKLVSKINKIKMKNYGYIGGGDAGCCETFTDYISFAFEDHTGNLINRSLFTSDELSDIENILIEKLEVCNDTPAVLCHGDIAKRNVIIKENGELVLIDWDEVLALCWFVDMARFTFWELRMKYGDDEYNHYRNVFLESYDSKADKSIYYRMENALHIWHCINYLNVYAGTPKYDRALRYFKELLEKIK